MKKTIQFSILILMALIWGSCSNDDNAPSAPIIDPSQQNQAPAQFDLLTVGNTSINIDVLPELTWETATDPEGDTVTYTILLDTNTNPQNRIANDISSTSFTIGERLDLNTTYYWKVRATDSNNNSTDSEIFSFSTRNLEATLLTINADFSPRVLFAASVFQNKIWVIGGRGPDGSFVTDRNDIWSSEDGLTWTLEVEEAPFSKRSGLNSVVFQQKLWVIGGFDSSVGSRNDVWSSTNGIDWTLEIEEANIPGLNGHELIVFNNRLWIIGGTSNFSLQRKVWSSADGINWVEEVAETPFSSRRTASTVFDGKLWVISGVQVTSTDLSDVWSSNNGVDWTLEIENAPFLPKADHTVVSFVDQLWVLAGASENPNPEADDFLSNTVWGSMNGTDWNMVPDAMQFPERAGHKSVLFNGGILLFGGVGEDGFLNDVWFLN
ncbi:hypothetical protein ACOKFD_11575 [Flagellimonas sp. S174]|uniref:hypothetical protein n=1 Tax=Flagellimonas sp. S174 TaxID=3410790 RepID=UPI003BF61953